MKAQAVILLSMFALGGCLESSTGPGGLEEPVIRLAVSGGVAGVEFTLLVDGPKREVVGEKCGSGCGFSAGEVLHGLTQDQSAYLADLFRGAGIHELAGTDFGTQCCDQFVYDLTYLDSEGESNVLGSSEAMPPNLREAVATVAAYARDVVPVVLAWDTDPRRWAKDVTILTEWGISGDRAEFQVSYPGGCRSHHFDLVVFGGWKESNPVQVSAFISHDANGDTCEALLEKDLTFDLTPLKKAYQEVYGVAEPGSTTLVIGLESALSPSSQYPIPLTYTF